MPWRLIQFIVVFAVFLLFIMFNLGEDNKCDINFGFTVISDTPVFLTAFFSFIVGMLCAFPFILAFKPKKKDKGPQNKGKFGKKPGKPGGDFNTDNGHYGID